MHILADITLFTFFITRFVATGWSVFLWNGPQPRYHYWISRFRRYIPARAVTSRQPMGRARNWTWSEPNISFTPVSCVWIWDKWWFCWTVLRGGRWWCWRGVWWRWWQAWCGNRAHSSVLYWIHPTREPQTFSAYYHRRADPNIRSQNRNSLGNWRKWLWTATGTTWLPIHTFIFKVVGRSVRFAHSCCCCCCGFRCSCWGGIFALPLQGLSTSFVKIIIFMIIANFYVFIITGIVETYWSICVFI